MPNKFHRQNLRMGSNPFGRKSNLAKIAEVFGPKKKDKKVKKTKTTKRMFANKGGGADMGTMGEIKSKLAVKYPHSNIVSINKRIDEKYLFEIIDDIDVVIDASDNFETRYLVNDICVEKQVPLVSGSCINQEGQIISFKNNDSGPCYECLFPRKKNLLDQNCESEGVIPTVAGSVGTFSSMQAISIILGDEECFNKLILINMKAGKIAQSFLSENPGCIICS